MTYWYEILMLFAEFFKTGLFAIGGGLATIPFLSQMPAKYDWFTMDMLTDMIAVAESTPGPIGVNVATYAGFSAAGIFGAIVATVGLVTPSVIVIVIVAKMLAKFKESTLVQSVFYGIRPAVAGLIAAAAAELFKVSVISGGSLLIKHFIIFIAFTAAVIGFKKINPIIFIALGAVAGIVFQLG